MAKTQRPSLEDLSSLTISEIEMRFRAKRRSVLRTFLTHLHGRRGAVLVGSAFIIALGLFGLWVAEKPVRASYAGEQLTASVWAQLEATSNERLRTMQVTLLYENGEKTFVASELGVRFDEVTTREMIESSEIKRKLLPWRLIDERTYTPTLTIDTTILFETLGKAGLLANAPQNAALQVVNGVVEVIPGWVGQSVDVEVLADQLLVQTIALEATSIRLPISEQEPDISDSEARQSAEEVQAFLDKGLLATYSDTDYTVPKEVLGEWLHFEVQSDDSIGFTLDVTAVRVHAEQFAASVARQRRDSVVYRTASGEQVVSVSGVTGRYVMNTEAIAEAWTRQQNATVELKEEPFAVRDGGLLNRYIVVDLATHTASAHDSDTVVATFPISGGKASTPTPIGTFRIFAKTRVQTMSGPGYSTPNVEWISWFYPDYALHGAYWHNQFGQANVSHGCVNLRNADAEWMYNWAPIGTTVIVRQG